MQFSSVTVQYRPLSDKDTNPSSKIKDMYIDSLVRLLKMFSYFLLFYCCGILIFRITEICIGTPGANDEEILWGTSIIMHSLGILVAVIGLRAVALKSRGSSRNFFLMLVLFDFVYFGVQGYYLYMITIADYSKYLKQSLGEEYSLYFGVYFLIITSFSLVFVTVKAYRFHILLSKLILQLNPAPFLQSIPE